MIIKNIFFVITSVVLVIFVGFYFYNKSTVKVKVAIIDTGINTKLSNFKNLHIEQKENFRGSHGTGVMYLINKYAKSNRVKYYSFVLNKRTANEYAQLINDAIDKNVDIINLSNGIFEDSKQVKTAIDKAKKNNIKVFAAAGNSFGTKMDYPAQYESVTSVGSLNEYGEISVMNPSKKSDEYCLGDNLNVINQKGNYYRVKGSSFATAICTGKYINSIIKKEK